MNQGVKKGSIYVLIGEGFSAIFLSLFEIFAGKWLGVEKYGLLKVLYDLIFLLTIFITGGVMENLSRNIAFFEAQKDKKGIEQVIQSSLLISFVTLVSLYGLIFIFRIWIAHKFFNYENLMLLQLTLGISILSTYYIFLGISLGYKNFKIFSFGTGAKEFLTLGFLFLIIKYNRETLAVGWSIVLSPILIILILFIILSKTLSIQWKNILKDFKKNNNFLNALKFIMTTKMIFIMNQCILRLGPPLIKIIAKNNQDYYAGIYSAITTPLKLTRTILIALCAALLPNLTEAYSKKEEKRIKRYIYKSFSIFLLITSGVTILYFLLGPEIIKSIYGEDFLAHRSDTTLIALGMSFFFMGTLMANIMIAKGTPKVPTISLFIGLVCMVLTIIFLKDILSPLTLIGISLLLCNFIYLFLQTLYFMGGKIKKKKI
ncbi:MAG: oligosaccharide flippase family protein [candidate division WOR-3 bacterium]